MQTKISVIVPVYNAGNYLRQCLDSLVFQTLDGIEIICIDNCSEDNSWSILEEYAHKYNNVYAYQNDRNRGQGYSVNRGLALASGTYIAECDSDDYVNITMYEKLYNGSQGADVVKCGFFDVYAEQQIERPQTIGRDNEVLNPMELPPLERMTCFGRQCHMQSGMARREFLISHALLYREGGVFEDTSLTFKIRTLADSYVYIPECLYYYRKNNPNSGTATIRNTYGICEQYAEMFNHNYRHQLGLDKELGTMRFYTYVWNSKRLQGKDKENFLLQASKDFAMDNVAGDLFNCDEDYDAYRKLIAFYNDQVRG